MFTHYKSKNQSSSRNLTGLFTLLLTGLLLSACGQTDLGNNPAPVNEDLSAQLAPENNLQATGCGFISEDVLVLQCAETSRLSEQYQQISAVVAYLDVVSNQLGDHSLSSNTSLGLLAKLTAGNNYLLGWQMKDMIVALNQNPEIGSMTQLRNEYFLKLRHLAVVDRVIVDLNDARTTAGSQPSQVPVRMFETTSSSTKMSTLSSLELALSKFRDANPALSSDERAELVRMELIVAGLKQAILE